MRLVLFESSSSGYSKKNLTVHYNINAVLLHMGRFTDILTLLLEDATPTGRDHIRYAEYPRFPSGKRALILLPW